MEVIFTTKQGYQLTIDATEKSAERIIEGINFSRSKSGPVTGRVIGTGEEVEFNSNDITKIEFVY